MSVIPSSAYAAFLSEIRNDPALKAEMRALSPDRNDWKAAVQGLENWFEANQAQAKAAMETASGLSLTASLARKLAKLWAGWKIGAL